MTVTQSPECTQCLSALDLGARREVSGGTSWLQSSGRVTCGSSGPGRVTPPTLITSFCVAY